MDIGIIIFVVVSFWVIVEFGASGLRLFSLSKLASKDSRPFIQGIAWMFMTISVFNLFWLMLVSAGQFISISDYPLLRFFATFLIVAIGVASIIGRRYWWHNTIKPAVNGHEDISSDEEW